MLGVASPSDSVYKGTDADLYCCINMDPRGVVASDGVSPFYASFILFLIERTMSERFTWNILEMHVKIMGAISGRVLLILLLRGKE